MDKANAQSKDVQYELPSVGFVRIRQLEKIVGFKKSTIWQRVRNSTFSAPIKLSPRLTVLDAGEIRAWISSQK